MGRVATGLSRAQLERLYVVDRVRAEEIARRCDTSISRVRYELHRLDLQRPIAPPTGLSARKLADLYLGRGLNRYEIARLTNTTPSRVAHELTQHGLRRPRVSGPKLSCAQLTRLYVDEGLSQQAVADRMGTTRGRVRAEIRRLGLDRPQRRSRRPSPLDGLTRGELERLHHEERLTIEAIATRLGVTPRRVREVMRELKAVPRRYRSGGHATLTPEGRRRLQVLYARADVAAALRRHGVPRRGRGNVRTPALTVDLLRELYEDCELSCASIGYLTGYTHQTVASRLRAFGIPLRPPPVAKPKAPRTRPRRRSSEPTRTLTKPLLRDLYVHRNMTLDEIARECGYLSTTPIRVALVRFGIPIRAHTYRDGRRPLAKARLERLYVQRGLSPKEIGEQLGGWTAQTVRVALRRHGIPTRRAVIRKRAELDAARLRRLYVRDEWTAAEIGERYGLSATVVRDRLHRAGVPLRYGGQTRGPSDRAPRLVELRNNRSVQAALRRHPVQPGKRLEARLLRRLYTELELSLFDIALITGRSKPAIARDLDAHGIPKRPPRSV